MANIADTRRVAFVTVSGQGRDSGHDEQAPQRQECDELPFGRHWLHFSRVLSIAGRVHGCAT